VRIDADAAAGFRQAARRTLGARCAAAEDPARLLFTDRHLQAAALIWLGAVIWILS
jgi:hypothetical protein